MWLSLILQVPTSFKTNSYQYSLQLRIKAAHDHFCQIDVIGLPQEKEDHRRNILRVNHGLPFEPLAQVGPFDEVRVPAERPC